MIKLEEAGDRFGDYSCVDCANSLCVTELYKHKIHQTKLTKFRSLAMMDRQTDSEVHDKGGKEAATDLALKKAEKSHC